MVKIIEEIKTKIAEGNLSIAVQIALDYFKNIDSSIYDKLIIISSKYKELESDKLKGIIDYSTEGIRRNSIKNDLLTIVTNSNNKNNLKKIKCFVIMPFSETRIFKSGKEIIVSADEWNYIFENWIKKAVESYREDFLCFRSPEVPGNFIKGIIDDIYYSEITIADLTGQKPNVYYELGIRHALKNGTIIISQDFNALPTDLKSYYCFEYKYTSNSFEYKDFYKKFENKIHKHIDSIIKSNFDGDNPVSDFLELEKYEKFETEEVEKIELFDNDAVFIGSYYSELVKVKTSSILYIQADSNYSMIYLENGEKHLISKPLKSVEDILPKQNFLRIHRSYIVNTKKIQRISRDYVTIRETELPLSRRMRDQLLKEIKRI